MALSMTTGCLFVSAMVMADVWGWRALLGSFLWLLFAWFSYGQLKFGQSPCWLSWDGSGWRIHTLWPKTESDPTLQPGYAMNVHLDLQKLLFVSLQCSQGERQWFWLSKDTFPDRWHGFRCAVYSRSEDVSS